MNNNQIKFVLIGGTALLNYGSIRVTLDTDIVVKGIDIDSLEHLKYLKEKSYENREDEEKKIIDKIDLDCINKKLN